MIDLLWKLVKVESGASETEFSFLKMPQPW